MSATECQGFSGSLDPLTLLLSVRLVLSDDFGLAWSRGLTQSIVLMPLQMLYFFLELHAGSSVEITGCFFCSLLKTAARCSLKRPMVGLKIPLAEIHESRWSPHRAIFKDGDVGMVRNPILCDEARQLCPVFAFSFSSPMRFAWNIKWLEAASTILFSFFDVLILLALLVPDVDARYPGSILVT
ncbi:hypothetical protein Nepgr_006777 [Nepenthes gracilis]|uniref:Uncharacterized protein n=1 Tax=Nepenthes gracilis TaxID=150966 RepID=A0AAD3S6G9_NEPGR|nr:hypothetical protein Nepgr_006777 [Nepenthes gracilis]